MAEEGPGSVTGAGWSPAVAVLTLHNVRNYGSVLQAFATQELLKEVGARCTVIDFRREGIGDDAASYFAGSRYSNVPLASQAYRVVRGRDARRRSLVFRDFLARRINLTGRHYSSFEELRHFPFDDYNAYCVGSDQVWNIEYNRDNRPFYLSFLPEGCPRFSFSSSIGLARLPRGEEERAREALSLFDGLSVREVRAYEYLMSLGLRVDQHVDPTLALSPEYWCRTASPPVVAGSYVLVYQLNRNPLLVSAAARLARRTGLPVVRIDYWPTARMPSAKSYITPSVEDFLGLIRNASFVVTDSFHGIAFSHIFETQFAAVPPPRYSGRIMSVLNLLGTDRNLVLSVEQVDDIALSWGVLSFDRERLAYERRRALDYLRSQVLG
nr:polysaccharide pyruvyl transferase family protein [uncultured Actinomyces sp.]